MNPLQVVHICNRPGYLLVELRTAENRPISMTLDFDETPALHSAYEHLCEVASAACESVFRDLIRLDVPDTAPVDPPMVLPPCRICEKKHETNVWVNGKPYCVDHAPA